MRKARSLQAAMEKYKSTGNNDFFVLQNDKETAVVRFLYGANEDELDWFVVHDAQIGGKKRYVQCTEDEQCPFCQAGKSPSLKLFIQLIDERDGKVKTWERGQKFIPKMLGLMQRYGALYTMKFEIERNGKKGDTQTAYEIYNLQQDNIPWEQLPAKQELLGPNGFVLDKTIPEMYAILNGTYQPQPVDGGTPGSERQQYQGQGGYQPRGQQQYQQPPQQYQAPPQQQQYQQPPAPQQQYQAPPQQNQYQAPPQQQQQYQAPPPAQQNQYQPPAQEQQYQAPPQEQQQPPAGPPAGNHNPPRGTDVF